MKPDGSDFDRLLLDQIADRWSILVLGSICAAGGALRFNDEPFGVFGARLAKGRRRTRKTSHRSATPDSGMSRGETDRVLLSIRHAK